MGGRLGTRPRFGNDGSRVDGHGRPVMEVSIRSEGPELWNARKAISSEQEQDVLQAGPHLLHVGVHAVVLLGQGFHLVSQRLELSRILARLLCRGELRMLSG